MKTPQTTIRQSPAAVIFMLITLILLIGIPGDAQIITMSLLDLRTKIANHPWSFHPGDSPVAENINLSDELKVMEEGAESEPARDSVELPPIDFAWAQPELTPLQGAGWIDDIEIQSAWTRYRDRSGSRLFKNFNEYIKQYKGYGWYRTSFTITHDDLKNRFRSRHLVLRLGMIGQADAAYLNGHFIGGTGLRPHTPKDSVIPDRKLFYDKMRYYALPQDLIKIGKPNIIAVRVFAAYNIAPGLSHGKYYISSMKKIERSKFWDDFKKIFVIVLTTLLGLFYLYWQLLFKEDQHASVYFALSCFAMAINTFMQSQIVYYIMGNAFWIKKIEFISFIIFIHLLLEFFVHFAKVESKALMIIDRTWDILGVAAAVAVLLLPDLMTMRRFMFAWGAAPVVLTVFLVYIIIRNRKIPSMASVGLGFLGLAVMLANDALVASQFRWVMWEFSAKDYGFAFFGIMAGISIVSNMKKTREMVEQQRAEKERLSKYFSPDVVETILAGKITLGGEEKNIVTLFADVVGFTSYSENHTPAEVVERLNQMFTEISRSIFTYKATLDKYIGDCVMAFWGAPRSTDSDAYNAVACALEMQKVCEKINASLPRDEKAFQLRIGINYGPSIVGNIGSHERMDYTVIGDAVNTASRIESNGIPGKVAISESVFNAAGGEQRVRYSETREIMVKGKSEPLKIYIVESIINK